MSARPTISWCSGAVPRTGPRQYELMDRPLTVRTYLDFEKPIAELESKVSELKALGNDGVSISDEVKKLEQKARAALLDTYGKLTP